MQDKMIILGTKEAFLVRVLKGKVEKMGIECEFVLLDVDSINYFFKDCKLATLILDSHEMPPKDALHFLEDKLKEKKIRLITVGEEEETRLLKKDLPDSVIYKSFIRPISNDEYVDTVVEYFRKLNSGEFMKSILVIDDDPRYLGLVREWLKDTFKVSMASSGLQGLKWLGNNSVDLILLDHEMPVTSGPQVLEMLRSDPDTKSIPVMFLTGKSDKESVMQVLSLKPEGYFLKSIKKEELIEKLQEFFILHK